MRQGTYEMTRGVIKGARLGLGDYTVYDCRGALRFNRALAGCSRGLRD